MVGLVDLGLKVEPGYMIESARIWASSSRVCPHFLPMISWLC